MIYIILLLLIHCQIYQNNIDVKYISILFITDNDILLPRFDPTVVNITFDTTLEVLVKYLNGLSILFTKN